MNPFLKFYPGDALSLLVANVLVQIAVVVALACTVALIFARHRAAVRHAIWLSALGCVLLSPAAAWLAAKSDWPLISLRLLPQTTASDTKATPAPIPAMADVKTLPSIPSHASGVNPFKIGDETSRLPSPALDVAHQAPVFNARPANRESARVLECGDSLPPSVARSEPLRNVAAPEKSGDKSPHSKEDQWRATLGMIVLFWGIGVAALFARLLHGCWSIARLRRRLRPIDGEQLAVLSEVRCILNVKRLPPLAILPKATELAGPITIGLLRPVVVLPERLFKAITRDGLRDVLVHEFAHAVRRDPLVGFVQRLAGIAYWPYPLVRFLNRRLAWAREEVCDNYVLRQGDAPSYAETLLAISQTFFSKPSRSIALGLFHPYGKLERRVAELLDPRRNVMVRIHRIALTVLAVLFSTAAVVVACTRLLHAEPPAESTPPAAVANPKPAIKKPAERYTDIAAIRCPDRFNGRNGVVLASAGYMIMPLAESDMKTKVAVSFARETNSSGPDAFHLVVKDKQGKVHEPVDENRVMSKGPKANVIMIVSRFSVPQQDVAQFVVQQSGEPDVPRETQKVSLPAYRVEAPDILRIEMLRMVPLAPYHLDTYDVLRIRATGVGRPPNDIDGLFLVEGEGVVTLGPAYGQVQVAGMTVEKANEAILQKLKKTFEKPEVSVQLAKTANIAPITGDYLVGPDGTINLRQYGTLQVTGKTPAEIGQALNEHLSKHFKSPDASVDVRQFNSKAYYVITEDEKGDSVRRVPITGNETVLDAVSAVREFSQTRNTKIWVARPSAEGAGHEQILPVDYDAIFRRGSAATNYQLMPGDRVFVVTKGETHGATADAKPSLERRAVNKRVKDFPEKVDLSTPESAFAAFERADARIDAKGEADLCWFSMSPEQLAESERFLKHDAGKNPEAYRETLLNEEIIEVLTYRNDLAVVIAKMKVPESAGKYGMANPYSSREFGRINRQWKNLGESRMPSVEAARGDFDKYKDARWKLFTVLRDDVLAGRTVPVHRVTTPDSYYVFGPVIERTLAEDEKRGVLTLATGEMVDAVKAKKSMDPPPDPSREANIAYIKAFAARLHIDLVAKEDCLLGFELAVFPMPDNRSWDEMPPDSMLMILKQAEGATPAVIRANKELPMTFFFKTRDGVMGVLQILSVSERKASGPAQRETKIRYKLLQVRRTEKTPPASQATATSLNIIQPLDVLTIRAVGTIPDQPIAGHFLVESDGQVALGPAYGRAKVDGLTWEQAEKKITEHLKNILQNPTVQVTLERRGGYGWRRAVVPATPYKIAANDVLSIRAVGVLPKEPIDSRYLVESTGTVALGPAYGRVRVKDLTVEEAEAAIRTKLAEDFTKPEVQVTLFLMRKIELPKAPLTIGPGTLLSINAAGVLTEQPINETYAVEPTGTVALGPAYGRVQVKGLTLEAAEKAIQKKLAEDFAKPEVQVTWGGWKDEAGLPTNVPMAGKHGLE